MDLTIIQNGQVVTSSLQVAENFEKEHKHILRDINNLQKNVPNFGLMFFETETEDSYGRPRKIYLMNRDGFTLLAMGFTGKKAMDFKLKYIEAFNEMERTLKQPQNSLELALRAALEHEQSIREIRTDVNFLKESMRIDTLQQFEIKETAQRSVVQALGGKEFNAYQNNSIRAKTFRDLWGGFNRHFKIPRYADLPKSKFDEALRYINVWRPSTSLQMEIDECNAQLVFV